MFSKDKTVLLRFTTFFLFLLLVWTALLTAFNLWVSMGPPNANPQFYRTRAETFFGVSIVLLVAFLGALRSVIRNQKHTDSQ